jgi:hypothetical protein
MTAARPERRRRKTARCQVCKERFKISPRGRPPTFCGRSCRQRAYEQRKWSRLRGRIPLSCSHGISPRPGCAILSGSKYANFCSKPESPPLHHHPSQSDGIRLCAWWKNRRVRRWRGVSTWFRAVTPRGPACRRSRKPAPVPPTARRSIDELRGRGSVPEECPMVMVIVKPRNWADELARFAEQLLIPVHGLPPHCRGDPAR